MNIMYEIQSLLDEISAPFNSDGYTAHAAFELKSGDKKPYFSLYITRWVGKECDVIWHRNVMPLEGMGKAFEEARVFAAEKTSNDAAQTANLAAVLGIPYAQAAE